MPRADPVKKLTRSGEPPSGRTGERIRERRLERGLKQVELARTCGISASYLNLIERDRRRIGGTLLLEIARALDAEPAALARGAGADRLAALREAAAGARADPAAPELHRAEAFATRYPGWAGLVAAQARRLRELERAVGALGDRLAHDPRLAAALHEVLSAATSIRSAAGILAEPGEIDPAWRRRFLRNIAEDSVRLAAGAEALAGWLGREGSEADGAPAGTPREEMEAWFAARPDLAERLARPVGPRSDTDPQGAGERRDAADPMAELPTAPAARELTRRWVARLRDDAARLPEAVLDAAMGAHAAADGTGHDLAAVAHALGRPLSLVLRRIAHRERAGLVICDATGAPVFRQPLPGFAMPRLGPACALWPLYEALTAPGRPVRRVVEAPEPDARRFVAWAVAETTHPDGLAGPALTEAVMLISPGDAAGGEGARAVGPGCRSCPRAACAARREPSILGEPARRGF